MARKVAAIPKRVAIERQRSVAAAARAAGLAEGQRGRIAGRIQQPLIDAAKARSGISSDTELLEYALARVALEDDLGPRLVARKGRIKTAIDLDF